LGRRFAGLEVVHQTGQRDLAVVREGYQRAGLRARAESFLDGVAREMNIADLVICRAGATTLAELAAVGRPAVLVPLPTAADDHQRKNAQVLAAAGAAVLLEQSRVNGETLAEAIADLLRDCPRLVDMGARMQTFARPNAAANIVDRLFEMAAA
jgi:UDP-N-acetylglucosamine--N-acetylmuramyl-(pentapeptide) pyrophosphoryl-undecaprenol N-acetylglucosamine transferase